MARLGALLAGERRHAFALRALVLVYVALMTRAQFAKFDGFGMGFDVAVYEQVIWNTAHGRWFATSNFKYMDVHVGGDLILLEAILAVPYALFPSTYTLLFLETVAVALGAFPLFWVARDRLGSGAGLGIAFAYLSYVPLHFLNLYEIQPRAFGLGLVFAMAHFLEKERLVGFLVSAVLLLTTRTDVALVVAMFGLYALLRRKPKDFALWALGLGVSWFILAVLVIVPRFNTGSRFQYLDWYGYLGRTPLEILVTMVTRPGLVWESLSKAPKLAYLIQILGPLAFLPLLSPGLLLLGAPTFALTLLSSKAIQSDIRYQYGAMLYPVVFLGTVSAIAFLSRRASLSRRLGPGPTVRVLVTAVVALNLLAHGIESPLWKWLHATPPSFAASARKLMARIPEGAPVAASSRLGSHLARREGLYFFPPRNEFYTDQGVARADYVLADVDTDSGDPTFEALKNDPWWRLVARESSINLFRRERPRPGEDTSKTRRRRGRAPK